VKNTSGSKKKWIILVVSVSTLIALSFFLYSGITGYSIKEDTITITYLGGVNNLPLYVALEKGYFEDEGINVKIIKLDSPNLIVDYVLSGRAEFGAPGGPAGTTAIAHHRSPGKLKIYNLAAESSERIGTDLIVKKDSDIKNVKDLDGKNFGILPGIQFKILARHIMKQEGLDEENTRLIEIPLGSQIQALASGQIDAVLTLEPIGTIAVKKGVARHLVIAPIAYYVTDPWFGGAGIVNEDFVRKNPEITAKVIDIFSRATEEVNMNPDENRIYLPKYTPLDEELSKEVPILFFRDSGDMTNEDIEALQTFLDLFEEYGAIEGNINVKSLLY